MQTVNSSLAEELSKKTLSRHVKNVIDKEQEFKDNLKASYGIAKEIIDKLPRFLSMSANAGHSHFYVIEINQFRPWAWEYSDRGHYPLNQRLSLYMCKKCLIGVPRALALWAHKNGLCVSVHDNFSRLAKKETVLPSCSGKFVRNDGRLELSCNYKFLQISW